MKKDLSGQRFGKLIAIKECGKDKCRRIKWLCQCDCGKTTEVTGVFLTNKHTKSCGCKKEKLDKLWKGYEAISGTYWHRLKNNAKTRRIKFSIDIREAWQQFVSQNKRCAITNIPLRFERLYKWGTAHLQTASLDRINNKKGYVAGNIQWVHKQINKIKGSLDYCELLIWAKAICGISTPEDVDLLCESRYVIPCKWKGYKLISGDYWGNLKRGAANRGIEFNVSIQDAWNLYEHQSSKCALSGANITFVRRYAEDRDKQSASLDRIDSSKGYVIGNIQWIHKVLNHLKWDITQDELLYWCKLIYENCKPKGENYGISC